MTYRTRLTLALLAIAVLPLAILGLGVEREMTARLDTGAAARVDAVRGVIIDRMAESATSTRDRVAGVAAQLARDARLRIALTDASSAERRWLTGWAAATTGPAGLTLLELQRADGGVLSTSGRGAGASRAALTATAPLNVRGVSLTVSGGVTFDSAQVASLSSDATISARLVGLDAPVPGGAVTAFTFTEARVVLVPDAGPIGELKAGVTRWLVGTLGLTLVVALGVATLLGRLVAAPLVELSAGTSRLDLDKLEQTFATGRTDELGALERTLDALVGRLRASVGRLKEAERAAATGELARQVNHDIKNGLAPIRNVLRHLAESSKGDPAAFVAIFGERHGTLESSVEYLDELARNYARLSPTLSHGPTNARPILEDLARGVTAARVELRLADALPAVRADAVVLRRIFENVISNAVDALEGKPGSVTVEAGAVNEGPDRLVRFAVTDTGKGMTPYELSVAFNDFHTTKAAGTGLGLSVVRRLLTDLGGSVRAESAPGQGTTFTVEIPAATAAA